MKYLDNVVRGIAVAAGSILNTVLSILLLGNELTASFIVGGSITLVSAHAYRNFPVPKIIENLSYFYGVILVPLLLLPIFNMLGPIRMIQKAKQRAWDGSLFRFCNTEGSSNEIHGAVSEIQLSGNGWTSACFNTMLKVCV